MSSPAEQLRQAAAQGDVEAVKKLLKSGAKADPDLEGRTALHLSSANGHAAVVKVLAEGGAKVNALDAAGYSPLHQAATEGHEEVVKLLLKHGCHVDTQDELHGNTALHEAAWKGYSRTLEILCKKGANVFIKNNGGFTPLHLSCQNGHNQCCRVLLYSACKPDVRNTQYGDTPLHTAARYGHAGVLRILISAFCNVNETNKNGDTALHISAAMGRNKLTRILLEAGSDQKLKNNQGETPRSIAERKQFIDVLRLMDDPPVTLIPVDEHPSKRTPSSKKREKDSGTSQESALKDKHKKSKKKHKVHFSEKEGGKKGGSSSPYGCPMSPDMNSFPQVKLQSLPKEPLKNGEQYYADLAGNIKKGPRGLAHACYCVPFFGHVERKLDSTRRDLLTRIDARGDELRDRVKSLERRTREQLVQLNQRLRENLALERTECAERIERKLFRERRRLLELQQQQQCQGLDLVNGNQPLLRSKSEDMLSDTNSNLTSAVTGTSRFTGNSHYIRATMDPAKCGTKPKISSYIPNISKLKMKVLGHDLKRESRSEGDLTRCHIEPSVDNGCNPYPEASVVNGCNKYPQGNGYNLPPLQDRVMRPDTNYSLGLPPRPSNHCHSNGRPGGDLWRNSNVPTISYVNQYNAGYQVKKQGGHLPQNMHNHNHDQSRPFQGNDQQQLKSSTRTQQDQENGVHPSNNSNGVELDAGSVAPPHMENDGSSFV